MFFRWTSQILAEIDSLPSSRFDLTGQPPNRMTGTAAGGEQTDSDHSISKVKAESSAAAIRGPGTNKVSVVIGPIISVICYQLVSFIISPTFLKVFGKLWTCELFSV